MVYCSVLRGQRGWALASWRVFTVCSRMDCILGPHWSQRPRAIRTTESAVRSRSGKRRASSRLMPGARLLVGQVDETHLVDERLGHLLQQPCHQVGVGVDDDDGVGACPAAFSFSKWAMMLAISCGLAHAGAGDVEVVSMQQVVGEA